MPNVAVTGGQSRTESRTDIRDDRHSLARGASISYLKPGSFIELPRCAVELHTKFSVEPV